MMNNQQQPLMQRPAPQQEQPSQQVQQSMQQDGDQDSDDGNAQGAQAKVVLAVSDLLYDEKVRPENIKFLKSDNPAVTVPRLTVHLLTVVDEKSGGSIPEEVILPAATESMDEVEEFASKLGITIPEGNQTDATMVLVQELMEAYGTTKEEVQEFIDQPENRATMQQIAQHGKQ